MNKRQEAIVDYLKEHKQIKNNMIVKRFDVSSETARKDLAYLEKMKIVVRIHGGAYYKQEFTNETDYLFRQTIQHSEKKEIAKKAVEFVSENQIIGLDVSTTNKEIAIELAKKFKNLTIITNSIMIATELSKYSTFQIIMPGGLVKKEELCFIGEESAEYIKQYNIDIFFMSFSGISLMNGFTDYGFGEASVKKQMIKNSKTIYAVGVSSKFSVTSLLCLCPLHQVQAVITDKKLSPVTMYEFEQCGVLIYRGDNSNKSARFMK